MADNVHFVTFRISQTGDYNGRREELYTRIRECAVGANYWQQPTSFVAFESRMSSNDIVGHIRTALDERYDLLALGSLTHKIFIVVGKNDDRDIFDFCDFAREL